VLSSFYYGYLVSQIPAGAVATARGGKFVLAVAVVLWSVATFLTAPAYSWLPALVLTRVVVGLAEGANYPAQVVLNAQWVPRAERSRAWAFISSGESVGTILAMLVCPFLAHHAGWSSIFWLSGVIGLGWLLLFGVLVSPTPEAAAAHRGGSCGSRCGARGGCGAISADELRLIVRSRGKLEQPAVVPWARFLASRPFRSLIVAHVCYNWGYYVVLSWLPTYYKKNFNVDYASMGIYGMLPYISLMVFSNAGGKAADCLLARGVPLTVVRRAFNTAGFLSPAICFFCLRWVRPCTHGSSCAGFGTSVTLLTLGVGLGGLAFSGYWANFQDLSPRFSGHLMGISNSIATIPGILGNLVTGQILKGHENDWGAIFSLASGIYIIGTIVFWFFASAEEQNFEEEDNVADSTSAAVVPGKPQGDIHAA